PPLLSKRGIIPRLAWVATTIDVLPKVLCPKRFAPRTSLSHNEQTVRLFPNHGCPRRVQPKGGYPHEQDMPYVCPYPPPAQVALRWSLLVGGGRFVVRRGCRR